MQIKYTAIAAVVLALGAGAAQAKIALPATGNGELFLSLYDTRGTDPFDDDKTLVVDLGGATGSGGSAAGRLNNWISDNTTSVDPVLAAGKQTNGYTITVLDPKVVAFLSSGLFADMQWSLFGGDSLVRDRILTTVNANSGGASQQFVTALRNANGAIAGYASNTNQGPEGDNTLNGEAINNTSLFVGDGAASFRAIGSRLGNQFVDFGNTAAVGESMAFYAYWENAATGAGNAKSARFGDATQFPNAGWKLYTDGRLVYSVPEPETYAMMGAGLLAIGAIARRRRAASA